MKTSASAPLVCALLSAMMVATNAAKESMTVTQDGTTFTVENYDDGRTNRYVVKFDSDGNTAKFKFNTEGTIKRVNLDTERYRVVHRTNGDLRRVRRTDSGARMLEMEDVEDLNEDGMVESRRRLYVCDDCEEAWDAVCDEGVPSACNIVNYGSPLTDAATTSLETFCESFGSACSMYGGEEVCVDQCDCERSLSLSLEWFTEGDLDLSVIEPSGTDVYYSNRGGDVGFLDFDNLFGPDYEPENYLLYSGLSTETDNVLGDYTAIVTRYSGSGSIPWKLTAMSNGEELWVEEGILELNGDTSASYTATVSEYIDNDCINTAASGDEEVSGDSEKYQTGP